MWLPMSNVYVDTASISIAGYDAQYLPRGYLAKEGLRFYYFFSTAHTFLFMRSLVTGLPTLTFSYILELEQEVTHAIVHYMYYGEKIIRFDSPCVG